MRLADEAGVLKQMQIEELGHRLVPSWTSPMGLFVPEFKDGKMQKETYFGAGTSGLQISRKISTISIAWESLTYRTET